MKILHIAFFNRAFAPEVSATGQLLTELAEGLANNHPYRVSVVTGPPYGTVHSNWKRPQGIQIACKDQLGKVSIIRARGTLFSKKTLMGRIVNYTTYFISACGAGLQLDRPDVITALTDPPIIGLAALVAARRFRAKLVISYRDLFPEVMHLMNNFDSPFVENVLHKVNRILFRHADRLIVLGEAMRERLLEKGAPKEKIVIIPDWADTEAIRPGPKENSFSKSNGLLDKFVVMHSGNFGASQNLESLIEAAAQLRDFQEILFLFIGEGVKKPMLEEMVRRMHLPNVRFLPYQRKEFLSETFASADCFLISLKEGLAGYITPSKLYGILAAGRPYVAAVEEKCDVVRITKHYESGLLARPGDSIDIAQKILVLSKDPLLRQRYGRNARTASEAFSRSKGIESYHKLFQELGL